MDCFQIKTTFIILKIITYYLLIPKIYGSNLYVFDFDQWGFDYKNGVPAHQKGFIDLEGP